VIINRFSAVITTRVACLAGCVLFAGLVGVASVSAAETNTKNMTIDQRLSRMERMMANQSVVEIFMQLQNLQREIETIRGELEVLTHDIGGMKQRQKDLYLDLDNRLQQVEMAASNGGSLSASGTSSGGDSSGQVNMTGEPQSEQESYQRGLSLLRSGSYQEAVNQFKAVLEAYPTGDYSDNAQYWLGEAYYVLRDFKAAIAEFAKVINSYPSSKKIADAHLKIGFSYFELQEWAKAKVTLERVVKDFAGTTASRLAQRRLQQLKLKEKG